MTKEIDIAKLRQLINAILSQIELNKKTSIISLDSDFYWDYDPNKRYEINQPIRDPQVGSLHGDANFLERMLDHPEEGFPLMLIHVAPILHYLGITSEYCQPTATE